jgi:hypothetical protein
MNLEWKNDCWSNDLVSKQVANFAREDILEFMERFKVEKYEWKNKSMMCKDMKYLFIVGGAQSGTQHMN